MKRHESIVLLSREHHFGLLFCWKIRQGIKKQVLPERMQSYVKYFWDNHLLKHFVEEETILFTASQDDLVSQAIADHRHIRQLVEDTNLGKPVKPEQFKSIADALDDHIRFEERVLFPHLEKELPEIKLIELGNRLQQLHQAPEDDNYVDEFWV
ncbi:MAG: hemerythrin domain-containing protein [Chitinophagaceae bacterium]|nr:MAG: hemerythrin domain-containing protein [Chitinophagaceae bacterium]